MLYTLYTNRSNNNDNQTTTKLKYKPTSVQNARKKMCIIVTAGNVILGFLMSDSLSIRDGSWRLEKKIK